MSGQLNGTAAYHSADHTLRWTPATRLGPSAYALTMNAGFRWWRSAGVWVASWTPEREAFLLEYVGKIEHQSPPPFQAPEGEG